MQLDCRTVESMLVVTESSVARSSDSERSPLTKQDAIATLHCGVWRVCEVGLSGG